MRYILDKYNIFTEYIHKFRRASTKVAFCNSDLEQTLYKMLDTTSFEYVPVDGTSTTMIDTKCEVYTHINKKTKEQTICTVFECGDWFEDAFEEIIAYYSKHIPFLSISLTDMYDELTKKTHRTWVFHVSRKDNQKYKHLLIK